MLLPERLGANTAATLLELAFLTNPDEATRLARDDYKQALAQAIAGRDRGPARRRRPPTEGVRAGRAPSALKDRSDAAGAGVHLPLFDTGEHVQTGGDLYPDQLSSARRRGSCSRTAS